MTREEFDVLWAAVCDREIPDKKVAKYIIQDESELWEFCQKLANLSPQKGLEIGNAHGGTTLFWQAISPEVFSLDIAPLEGHIPEDYFPNVEFIIGDSHAQETRDMVAKRGPYDFLFIDGDHSTDGVRLDYEMYSPLVRVGGLVGFHDYNHNPVRTFLETLPDLQIMPRDYFGIAVLKV